MEMRPGDKPISNLAEALTHKSVLYNSEKTDDGIPYQAIIESSLRRSSNGLVQVYKDAHLPANENLLIVVDQFEELFRFRRYEKENNLGKSDATHFIQLLLAAAQQKECLIYVLLTMRSDFLGDCAEFRGLPEAINLGQYLVPRMTREQIREAITMPVAVSMATITQRLVTRLLNDINNDTDQLPVMQHAMMRTWNTWYERKQLNTPIDFADYEQIGTMEKALSQHADEAYEDLTIEGDDIRTVKLQRICELMFKALTDKAADVRGVRRPQKIQYISNLIKATKKDVIQVVDVFRKPGRTFLIATPNSDALTGESIIDISHESLMRKWERLVKWTEDEAVKLGTFRRLAEDAKNEERDGLNVGPKLQAGLDWLKEFNGDVELVKLWVSGFNNGLNIEQQQQQVDLALDFLQRSNGKAIEVEKETQRLRKLEQDKKEDDAKREKEEEARRRKNKILLAIIATLIVFVFAGSWALVVIKHQKDAAQQSAIEADYSARVAERERTRAQSEAELARISANEAKKQKHIADSLKGLATDSANYARAQKDSADIQKGIALNQKSLAENNKIEADKQRKIATRQNILTAPNEYARLIREVPTEATKISKDTFDYKLIAYCNHLDNLESLTKALDNNNMPLKSYYSLKEKLYNNNDLYEKLYFTLKKYNKGEIAAGVSTDPNDEKLGIPLNITANSVNTVAVAELGNRVTASASNKVDRINLCATTDNFIYVYRDGSDGKPFLENRIATGVKITALDYNENGDIIYFGTVNGDIGFIKYKSDNKNQPVFQNSLYSKITATKFFVENGHSYLLVAGLRSRPVVFLLNADYLLPGKNLGGNVYPEKISNDVLYAEYDKEIKRIKLFTKPASENRIITYLWNPFSVDLLNSLKKIMQVDPTGINRNKLVDLMSRQPEIKIY
ncbi:MAG TPA: hypothetical protein PKL37_13265 [Panacibacter sp.]|nr:hypothetical protein [Panacibacter sp.]